MLALKTGPNTEDLPAESIRTQLDKILSSEPFRESERLRQFLRFTVDLTLKGEGSQIKEYLIGVDVFGKEESFDPRTDAIVRVQAGKLRSKLAKYYAAEGREDPVIIEYPKGRYIPSFKLREATAPALRSVLGRRWKAIAMGTVGLVLAGFAIYRAGWLPRTKQPAGQPASIAVLPFVDMKREQGPGVFLRRDHRRDPHGAVEAGRAACGRPDIRF